METSMLVSRIKSAFAHAIMFRIYLYIMLFLSIPLLGKFLNVIFIFNPFVLALVILSGGPSQIETSHLNLAIFLQYPVIGFIWGAVRPVPVLLNWQLFRTGLLRFLVTFGVLAALGIITAFWALANDS